MSGIIYQYQQAYMPANGNTFHFWVDCSKEIYEEEAAEGGTVRLLYSAPKSSLTDIVPDGWKLVPVVPTEDMVIRGFESESDEVLSESAEWEKYSQMSGCQQAAYKAELCWAAMLAAAPEVE